MRMTTSDDRQRIVRFLVFIILLIGVVGLLNASGGAFSFWRFP